MRSTGECWAPGDEDSACRSCWGRSKSTAPAQTISKLLQAPNWSQSPAMAPEGGQTAQGNKPCPGPCLATVWGHHALLDTWAQSFPAELTPTWRVPVPHPQQGSSSPSIPTWGSAKSPQRPCSQAVSLQCPSPQQGLALSLSRMRPFRGDAMRQALVPGQLLRPNCGSKFSLDREERFDSKASLISCVCPGPVGQGAHSGSTVLLDRA